MKCEPYEWLEARTSVLFMVVALTGYVVATTPAEAQAYQVLHTFTTGTDAAKPSATLLLDRTGLTAPPMQVAALTTAELFSR